MLVDGDVVVYESAIINEYLNEKFSQFPLMPKELGKRSRARIWVDFCNSRLQAAGSDVVHGDDPEKARGRLREHLKTLDREMTGRTYIVEDFSLADITYIPFFTRQQRYGVAIDDSLPDLNRWMERLLARPAVKSTLEVN
ncbi:MAG: hypothetical protein A3F90_02795 [Deltaproteobacteria bacterium RIFCSPLOWO2_12_FULL_60_19]|nr:MAG: hypothetical protein A3F90_02795 [Deltaproteobacteria bacterium RIFCSPLOWO2_12_FULL_60_19]